MVEKRSKWALTKKIHECDFVQICAQYAWGNWLEESRSSWWTVRYSRTLLPPVSWLATLRLHFRLGFSQLWRRLFWKMRRRRRTLGGSAADVLRLRESIHCFRYRCLRGGRYLQRRKKKKTHRFMDKCELLFSSYHGLWTRISNGSLATYGGSCLPPLALQFSWTRRSIRSYSLWQLHSPTATDRGIVPCELRPIQKTPQTIKVKMAVFWVQELRDNSKPRFALQQWKEG